MGGLLSGIDQSLISGANLFMPSCKFKSLIWTIFLSSNFAKHWASIRTKSRSSAPASLSEP